MKHLFTVILLFLIPVSFAWNYVGHVLVAEITYQQLTPSQQKRQNAHANIVYSGLSQKSKKKVDSYVKAGASKWAAEAFLPDVWKHKRNVNTIDKTLKHYDASVPSTLGVIGTVKSGQLHYIDLSYPDGNSIDDPNYNVVKTINILRKAYNQSENTNTHKVGAILSVYLAHFMGDIRQPLHTFARNHDAGGNKFCLSRGVKHGGWCKKPLHAQWDKAFGHFNISKIRKAGGFEKVAKQYITEYPKSRYTKQLAQTDPMQWARWELATFGKFVYSTPEYQKLSKTYKRKGYKIAKSEVALAGYTYAKFLNSAKMGKIINASSKIIKSPIRKPIVGHCKCPYDKTKAGHKCGKRSAYNKRGGEQPICYTTDKNMKQST